MLKINDVERLYLGVQGETGARTITIDVSAWIDYYPNGSVTIWHQRNGDATPSATGATYDADTKTISWTPTDTDTYNSGEGMAEIRLTDTNVIKKRKKVKTGVSPSVTLAGTTLGSDWQSYINAVDGLRAAAVTAKEAAEDAQEDAEDAAEDAEAWAVGQRGGEDVESTDPTYHNNSKYYAEAAADDADDAETAKNDAVSAKNAAVSAKVDAEAAQIAAETAKTAAQTAQAAAEEAAQSAAGQAVALIDDTAGDGVTNKVWSAKKVYDELATKYEKPGTGIPGTDLASAVQTSLGKADTAYQKPDTGIPAEDLASGVIPTAPVQDVQVNGTSVLSQGVANVPIASSGSLGVVKVNGNGLAIASDGTIATNPATTANCKDGTAYSIPITPNHQHDAVFYGLAKASGDTTQASSANAVGTYTADALVKIQKMLGIYEAPWELIREDTVTNATEASIEITVDDDGNAFELTDAILLFETPKQNNSSGLGGSGIINFICTTINKQMSTYIGPYTQEANASARSGIAYFERKNGGLLVTKYKSQSSNTNGASIGQRYYEDFAGDGTPVQINSDFYVNKVAILRVTGTGHYKLYGKRKWN